MTVAHAVRCHVANVRMAMLQVVPSEEGSAVGTGMLEATKPCGGVVVVLHGIELGLQVRVVGKDVRADVTLGGTQISQQGDHRLEAHAGTAIGLKGPPWGPRFLRGQPSPNASRCLLLANYTGVGMASHIGTGFDELIAVSENSFTWTKLVCAANKRELVN